MVNITILAGGFTTYIISYLFDSDARTLSVLHNTTTGANPSWIASHPKDLSILYAVNEKDVGQLQSYTVGQGGVLTLVDTVATGGIGPTFTNPLTTGEVSAMNFGSPNCSFVPTEPGNPLKFLRDAPVVSFPVPAGFPSNPHMSLEHEGEIFVPDLGGDKIWRIVNDGAPGKFRVQGQIDFVAGNGPRHIAIRDNVLYTLHEKTNSLTAQLIPAGPNSTALPLIANVSIAPELSAQPKGSVFAAAEILIPPTNDRFPNPLIYVSNRNIGNLTDPAGDSIAIFEFKSSNATASCKRSAPPSKRCRSLCRTTTRDAPSKREIAQRLAAANIHSRDGETADLVLVKQFSTGLHQIRGMMHGREEDGGDEFIAAAGVVGTGGVLVLRRVDGGRDFEEVARNKEEATRSSFVFV